MKRVLKSPTTNAICLSLFTAFYSLIFIGTSNHKEFISILYYANHIETLRHIPEFGLWWSQFLADGNHQYIAYILIAVTAVNIILLVTRRKPYDEYHVDRLITCLVAAIILTMIAIAIFYVSVLSVSNGIVESFTLFIAIHWATVVFADFIFVLLCRRR